MPTVLIHHMACDQIYCMIFRGGGETYRVPAPTRTTIAIETKATAPNRKVLLRGALFVRLVLPRRFLWLLRLVRPLRRLERAIASGAAGQCLCTNLTAVSLMLFKGSEGGIYH